MNETERLIIVKKLLGVIRVFRFSVNVREDWIAIIRMLRDNLNAYLFADKFGTTAAAASRILKSTEDMSKRKN